MLLKTDITCIKIETAATQDVYVSTPDCKARLTITWESKKFFGCNHKPLWHLTISQYNIYLSTKVDFDRPPRACRLHPLLPGDKSVLCCNRSVDVLERVKHYLKKRPVFKQDLLFWSQVLFAVRLTVSVLSPQNYLVLCHMFII